MKKKLSIVGTNGVPGRYGGWETMVDFILPFFSDRYEVTVFCSSHSYDTKIDIYKNASLHYIDMPANGFYSILYDILSIWKSRKSDIILLLGISGVIFLPIFRIFFPKIRIVTNVDGIEWKRKKFGKLTKIFLRILEHTAANFSGQVIGDNINIVKYLNNSYNINSRFIPFGGDHVKAFIDMEKSTLIPDSPYCLSICRIEPENNIEMILMSAIRNKDINFCIVGNWNHSNYGEKLKEKFGSNSNIFLLDPIYDLDELGKLRSNCKIYIHGHSVGGTNPSLVEAMWYGLQILAFDVVFNRSTTNNMVHFFADCNDLSNKVRGLFYDTFPKEKKEEIVRYASEKYTWKVIAQQYIDVFESK